MTCRRGSRVLAAIGGVAALVLLAGCDVAGRVDVHRWGAEVDLTITHHNPQAPCASAAYGTSVLGYEMTSHDDRVECHYAGSLRARQGVEQSTPFWLTVADDLATLGPRDRAALAEVRAVDVTVTFPGPVEAITGSGAVRGTSVHVTDAADLTQGAGLVVVARMTPAPLTPWLWAAAGAASGFALVLLAARHRRP